MPKETITLELDSETRRALDTLAAELGRDRAEVFDEAVKLYLEMHLWQVKHILEGIHQADSERFATPEEVAAAFNRWHQPQ